MDRRDFLLSSLAVSALASFRASSAPTFGCAAITWDGNDRAAIDDIAALGFRGIQLRGSAVAEWSRRPAELRDLLASRNLSFVALSSGLVRLAPSAERDALELHTRHARFVRDAGGSFLQVVDERPTGRAPDARDFARMGRLLTEIGRRTADLGVTLAYHNHMGNLGQTPNEIQQVLEASDARAVRLLLDVAHFKAAGGDPVAAVSKYAERLAFLHLKDLERPKPGGDADSYRFVELGSGSVDIAGVLAALQRVTFTGWAIVELDEVTDPSLTPRACTQRSKDYLASIGYAL